jgi:hypothetical protein
VPAGDTVTLTGAGLPPNTPLLVQLFSDPVTLATTTTDALGAFRIVVTIPADTPAGLHTIVITGPGGVPRVEVPLTVGVAAAATGIINTVARVLTPILSVPTFLARTGWSVLGATRFAAVLVAGGAILVAMAWQTAGPARFSSPHRRRRRRRRQPWS